MTDSLKLVVEDESLDSPDHKKYLQYVVAVEWQDTVVSNAWTDEAEVRRATSDAVVSFGCLVSADKDQIVLSAGVSERAGERQHNPTITIPRPMVRRVWSAGRWAERSLKGR